MKTIILNVKGMMCTGCEKRIENSLKSIDGIENVEANHDEGIVKITLNEDIDKNIIKEQIEDLDFEVVE